MTGVVSGNAYDFEDAARRHHFPNKWKRGGTKKFMKMELHVGLTLSCSVIVVESAWLGMHVLRVVAPGHHRV